MVIGNAIGIPFKRGFLWADYWSALKSLFTENSEPLMTEDNKYIIWE